MRVVLSICSVVVTIAGVSGLCAIAHTASKRGDGSAWAYALFMLATALGVTGFMAVWR